MYRITNEISTEEIRIGLLERGEGNKQLWSAHYDLVANYKEALQREEFLFQF